MPKLVFVGCGAVGQALLEMIPKCDLIPNSILGDGAMLLEPRAVPGLNALRRAGLVSQHRRVALTPQNIATELNAALERGDVVLDVSVNVDAIAVMEICQARGCLYVNTSLEDWAISHPERLDATPGALEQRSLYARLLEAERRLGGRGRPGDPTAIVDHGMNPGLISHFARRGLGDYANHRGDEIALRLHSSGRYAECAERLGLRVIHVSERDTQRAKPGLAADRDTFYNTWSVDGFVAEARDPVQIGFGSHESDFEKRRFVPPISVGPRSNVRFLPERGMDCRVWSVCPTRDGHVGTIRGRCIPHGEANTLSAALTHAETGYRPSVYYVYRASPAAERSLKRLRRRDYVQQKRSHVLNLEEIETGYDAVGALLWFREERNGEPEIRTWWCGTVVSANDARDMGFARAGPTVIQVAASILSVVKWMLAHPRRGLLTPEDLPHEEILTDAAPFLGKLVSRLVPVPDRSLDDLSFSVFSDS